MTLIAWAESVPHCDGVFESPTVIEAPLAIVNVPVERSSAFDPMLMTPLSVTLPLTSSSATGPVARYGEAWFPVRVIVPPVSGNV